MKRNKKIGIVLTTIAALLVPVMIYLNFAEIELTDKQVLVKYWYIYLPFMFLAVAGLELTSKSDDQ